MSIVVEKEKNRIKVVIPNSEAIVDAQLKGIKDADVTGYYTNDAEEEKNKIVDFISRDYDYLLDKNAMLDVIIKIRDNFYEDYKNMFKDGFKGLLSSYDYFNEVQDVYINIPRMFLNKNSERYLKFDNENAVVKKMRSALYGWITGFYIIDNGENYIIKPFVVDDAKNILDEKIGKEKMESDKEIKELNKEKFRFWLEKKDINQNTVDKYVSKITLITKDAMKDGIINDSIYNIVDVQFFDEVYEILKNNKTF